VISRQYREHKDSIRNKFSEESYRVTTLLSTEWRVDLTLCSSANVSVSNPRRAPSVQLKLELDSEPHRGGLEAGTHLVDGNRIKELAFELETDKLDILLHELVHAQTLMESIEN
jgi:hypothetical protein